MFLNTSVCTYAVRLISLYTFENPSKELLSLLFRFHFLQDWQDVIWLNFSFYFVATNIFTLYLLIAATACLYTVIRCALRWYIIFTCLCTQHIPAYRVSTGSLVVNCQSSQSFIRHFSERLRLSLLSKRKLISRNRQTWKTTWICSVRTKDKHETFNILTINKFTFTRCFERTSFAF